MFEYLMPLLVMRNYPGTLLDETYRAVIERQMQYGDAARRAVGHLGVGLQRAGSRRNYQYRAFGVPGLGLKRGWPTISSSRRTPPCWRRRSRRAKSLRNLERLRARRPGRPLRLSTKRSTTRRSGCRRERERGVVLPTFMAHHQGMSLVALDNAAERLADAAAVSRRSAQSRRPICCCRSASRSWCRSRIRRSRPPITCRPPRRCRAARSAAT